MHRSSPSLLAAAVAAGLLLPVPAARAATELQPVVVTANRHAVPADKVLASVTVLERADIEASQAPDLLSLLARQAGVDIARTGGPGQASTVFLRGGNSGHALVLVDGVRVNAATSGVLDFAHLPLAQVERIEIVRGPRAALWGSDAIGGVIQVFTRDPAARFFEAHAGSGQRGGASAGLGLARGDSRLGLSAGADAFDGFSATRPGAFGHDPDTDGYVNRNLALRGRTTLGTQQLSATALVTDADVQFDQGETAAINRVFGLRLEGALAGERWQHALLVGRSSEDLDTPAYASEFGSARDSVDWIHALRVGERHALNWGVNWSRERGYSFEFGSGFDRSRRNLAGFASWRGAYGPHLLEASLRRDDYAQFGGATTGNLGWGWRMAQGWRLRAGWGEGFRAPNFNELFYPGFFGLFAGNPDLHPERSRSAELGLAWEGAQAHASLSAYRTRVRDLIAFQGVDFEAINVARAAVDGVELEGGASWGRLALAANATWQHARDLDSGLDLLRRARRKANLAADWQFGNGASVGADLAAVSARPDFGARLQGYARLDLRASVPLAGAWTLDARVENVGDRDYMLVDGYNTPGRTGLLSLRWQGRD